MRCVICAVVVTVFAGGLAWGQNASTISAGYSNIQFGHNNGLWYERSGGYVDGDILWRVSGRGFPLLLGGGISGSAYSDRQDVFATFSDGYTGEARLYSDVGLFSLEARVASPIAIGNHGFFLLPKFGAGLLVDNYSIDRLNSANGFNYISTQDYTGAAFEIRPGIQAGYSWGWGSAGLDLSYMAAWGDFGQLGSRAQEFRAGAFIRFRF